MHPNRLFLTFVLAFAFQFLNAQDVEGILKNDNPIKLSGGVSTEHYLYSSNRLPKSRDPYSMVLAGNLNLKVYEWNVPVSFRYTNQQLVGEQPFNQPIFNQFGISPYYKWIKLYAGYNSMTYSKYTLNGHVFLGGGVDLTPKNFEFSVMYGRFQTAVEYDSSTFSIIPPSYERYGGGLKIGYQKDQDYIRLIYFRSADKQESLTGVALDSLGLYPESNSVSSVLLGKKIGAFHFTFEGANSAITEDIRNTNDNSRTTGLIHPFFDIKNSTTFQNAFNAKLTYSLRSSSIGLEYERVDPEYKTHGSYFFNNDLENISAFFSIPLFSNKIQLDGRVGKQRNNLSGNELSDFSQWVSSFNVNVNASKRFNFSISYSNFSSFTNIRSQFETINSLNPYENLDSLNFRQVTNSASFNSSLILSESKSTPQHLGYSLSWQGSKNEQGEENQNNDFINSNISYNIKFKEIGISTSLIGNYNRNSTYLAASETYGPTLSASKSLMKNKLNSRISYSWNQSLVNGDVTGGVNVLRLDNVWRPGEKGLHSFTLGAVYLVRNSSIGEYLEEMTINFRYGLNF